MNYKKLIRSHIKSVPAYVAGKSIQETAEELGLSPFGILKLSSNENPLGPSPKAVYAACESLKSSSVYPLPDARFLKSAIAKSVSLNPDSVFATGPGMDSLIDTFCKLVLSPEDEVIISVPTFSFYEIAARVYGATPVFIPRDPDFSVNADEILKAVSEKTKIIFICSPNNPTGNSVSEDVVRKLAEKSNSFIFLDEAYVEFSSQGSLIHLLTDYENIVIGRTLSKIYGLAGLRIGYGLMKPWLACEMQKIALPFSISSVSETAAVAALSDTEHFQSTFKMVQTGRKQLIEGIHSFTPFKAAPSDANFIMVDVSPFYSRQICDSLLKDGIIIRSCDSFRGCGKHSVRITVGTFEMNEKVIKSLSNASVF